MSNPFETPTGAETSPATQNAAARAEWFAERFALLQDNIASFIRGKPGIVSMALVCMMAEGHLLIDDIPGVGKTSLAKAIARSIQGHMSRIQFTPDLLPSDVTGTSIWSPGDQSFYFREGAVFANVVVADEINRASPKTQSALLEVMEERHVTIDLETRDVPRPFIVLATQNPVELGGTYHLPEAQIDRFMMRISIGYPDHDAEVDIVAQRTTGRTVEELDPVIDVETAQAMIRVARETYVAPQLHSYAVSIAAATRRMPELRLGVSPRGTIALVAAAQSYACAQGREFVTADDIKTVIPHVLGHRMLLSAEAELSGQSATTMLQQVSDAVPIPDARVGH